MEPYNPIILKERPERCPICGGEVWKILYGEPTPEAYEKRHETKTIFAGCCITEHDPAWQCDDCYTPIYEGTDMGRQPHMAYATCIVRHEDLLPITKTVIHIAYDTKNDRYAAQGIVRTYYGNDISEYALRVGKERVRQLFSDGNMQRLAQAAKVTELPLILDGASMWLRVECGGELCTIERNSANVDMDDTMPLFMQQMEKIHARWHNEEGYEIGNTNNEIRRFLR